MHSLGLAESLILSVMLSISLQAAFLLESIPINMLSDSIFPEHPSFATYFSTPALFVPCPTLEMYLALTLLQSKTQLTNINHILIFYHTVIKKHPALRRGSSPGTNDLHQSNADAGAPWLKKSL